MTTNRTETWPALDYAQWSDTATTLQLWTQVVGKVRLTLSPWVNHGWQVPLYVNARGLGTSPMHVERGMLEIDFDFIDQRLVLRQSNGPQREFALRTMSVADFYRQLVAELAAIGVDARINTLPNEVAAPIPFPDDQLHADYDADAAQCFWRVLIQVDRVFKLFRTCFLGKVSPVHLFWGSFDLAITRFSGRKAPLHPGGVPGLPDNVTREAYSHEVSSAGFWPGGEAYPRAAFYSCAYPTPAGFAHAKIEPDAAVWVEQMGEWLLPYEAVRTSADPADTLMRFLQTSYRAAADLAQWDPALECGYGQCGHPRQVSRS
jgi:hypothetical protein